ncbi:MAG: GtrA family protein [Clostridia bacterium]|nr:GtrA family protein [Clostridia bacterium]
MAEAERITPVERFFRWVEKIVRTVVGFFLRLIRVELTEKQWAAFLQFVRYCVVGLANTVVNLLFNYLTLWLLEKTGWNGAIGGVEGFNRHLGTAAGFVACCVNSYFFNSRYTFDVDEKQSFSQHFKALLKVMVSYSFAVLFLGWALNILWVSVGLNSFLGALINVIVGIPINFVLNKFWAFK